MNPLHSSIVNLPGQTKLAAPSEKSSSYFQTGMDAAKKGMGQAATLTGISLQVGGAVLAYHSLGFAAQGAKMGVLTLAYEQVYEGSENSYSAKVFSGIAVVGGLAVAAAGAGLIKAGEVLKEKGKELAS